MKELEDLAETVRSQLNLKYDQDSVKFIEGFIERQKDSLDSEQRKGLVTSLGSFIGQCIIVNYGGQWHLDDGSQALCIMLDGNNKIFPFAKTAKQLENGLEDSVYSFYTMIPRVFNTSLLTKTVEAGSPQAPAPPAEPKKWWKFWKGK